MSAIPTPTATDTACNVCGSCERHAYKQVQGYTIVCCASCGLHYLHPQPSPQAIAALYAEQYFHSDDSVARGYDDYTAQAENQRRTFRNRLRLLGAPAGKLLDVGAAAGFFVEQARQAGWQAEGIEPSEWASRYAREALGQPVSTGTLESAAYPEASFDALTMWEVIEHLSDPRAFLQEVARVLRPGGTFAFSTPDAGAPLVKVVRGRWLGWQKVPEHLYFFDRAALRRLLEESGFEVVSERYVSLDVGLGFALERLGGMLGMPWLGKLPAWIRNRSVSVNPLYDLMVVARRKGSGA